MRAVAVTAVALLTVLGGCAAGRPASPAPPTPPQRPAAEPQRPAAEPQRPAAEPQVLSPRRDDAEVERLRRQTEAALARAAAAVAALDAAGRERHGDTVGLVEGLIAEGEQALAAGEIERAHGLAVKADTLAQELQ